MSITAVFDEINNCNNNNNIVNIDVGKTKVFICKPIRFRKKIQCLMQVVFHLHSYWAIIGL